MRRRCVQAKCRRRPPSFPVVNNNPISCGIVRTAANNFPLSPSFITRGLPSAGYSQHRSLVEPFCGVRRTGFDPVIHTHMKKALGFSNEKKNNQHVNKFDRSQGSRRQRGEITMNARDLPRST